MKGAVFFFFVTLCVPCAGAKEIRVLLDYVDAAKLHLDVPEDAGIEIKQGGVANGTVVKSSSVEVADGLVMQSTKGHQLQWRGKQYRGRLEIRETSDGRLALVNALELEDYLYGVLPSEVDTKVWPMEALKTQAVASRSYALSIVQESPHAAFHVGATAKHQVYFGAGFEDERALDAVNSTKGEILVDRNSRVMPAYFHSTCGGRTEDARFVWSADASEDLVGVSDFGYCKMSPYYSWVTSLPESRLAEALKKLGFGAQLPVRSLLPGEFTRSMRALSLRIASAGGRMEIKTASLRQVLGASWIRSTKITRIRKHKDKYIIHGVGYGHGVGLCQWGARGMADKGKDYKRILKHYFPKASLTTEADI